MWPEVTIYHLAFGVVLFVALCWSARRPRTLVAGLLLVANYAWGLWGWHAADPVLSQAMLDLVTAAIIVSYAAERWELGIALAYVASVLVGGATWLGLIPGPGERPLVFLAFSHADIVNLAGYAASLLLGLGSGDSGKRVTSWFGAQADGLTRFRTGVSAIVRWSAVHGDDPKSSG